MKLEEFEAIEAGAGNQYADRDSLLRAFNEVNRAEVRLVDGSGYDYEFMSDGFKITAEWKVKYGGIDESYTVEVCVGFIRAIEGRRIIISTEAADYAGFAQGFRVPRTVYRVYDQRPEVEQERHLIGNLLYRSETIAQKNRAALLARGYSQEAINEAYNRRGEI